MTLLAIGRSSPTVVARHPIDRGVWMDDNLCFTTGESEQKARNIAVNRAVVVTAGRSDFEGTDIVIEGEARRNRGRGEARPAGRSLHRQVRGYLPIRRARRAPRAGGGWQRRGARLRGGHVEGLRFREGRSVRSDPLAIRAATRLRGHSPPQRGAWHNERASMVGGGPALPTEACEGGPPMAEHTTTSRDRLRADQFAYVDRGRR